MFSARARARVLATKGFDAPVFEEFHRARAAGLLVRQHFRVQRRRRFL
jgi:hypothetical protein